MTGCREVREWTHHYVDDELSVSQQWAFEAHLLDCDTCRAEYDKVRQVVDIVRGSKPLYPTDGALPHKVQEILAVDLSKRSRKSTRVRVAAMAGAFALTILLVALLPLRLGQRFTSFAADTHLRFAQGSLPLGVSSHEPAVVSAWLETQLPFHLSLPNYPAGGGGSKSYSLVGARLIRYNGEDVAYLAYTMAEHPISLLVSSSPSAIASEGGAYASGRSVRGGSLLFHFSSEKGLKLITWRDRGLSYALVSDVKVDGAQSCVVCHGSDEERRKFENLLRPESSIR